MFNYSDLQYPPIKPQKLPKYLILRNYSQDRKIDPEVRVYAAISTKTGEICGQVSCVPETIMQECQRFNSLYVESLTSVKPNNGVGTILLDFVKYLSKKNGCGGNFHLCASSTISPHRVPHVFYRKFGMTTGKKYLDEKLDQFIKEGKNATSKDFESIVMYYPPTNTKVFPIKKPKAFVDYITDLLKKFGEYSRKQANNSIKFI